MDNLTEKFTSFSIRVPELNPINRENCVWGLKDVDGKRVYSIIIVSDKAEDNQAYLVELDTEKSFEFIGDNFDMKRDITLSFNNIWKLNVNDGYFEIILKEDVTWFNQLYILIKCSEMSPKQAIQNIIDGKNVKAMHDCLVSKGFADEADLALRKRFDNL